MAFAALKIAKRENIATDDEKTNNVECKFTCAQRGVMFALSGAGV
jgi:hypothetical protein